MDILIILSFKAKPSVQRAGPTCDGRLYGFLLETFSYESSSYHEVKTNQGLTSNFLPVTVLAIFIMIDNNNSKTSTKFQVEKKEHTVQSAYNELGYSELLDIAT